MNDNVKASLDKIKKGVEQLKNSEEYKLFMLTMSKFHNYSLNNMILINIQKPEATLVAGYNDWLYKFKRYVRKGEKGIKIIAPCPYKIKIKDENDNEKEEKKLSFKVTTVFDISQTEGEDLPKIGVEELMGTVEKYQELKRHLEIISRIPIEYKEIKTGAKGYYNTEEDKIYIKEGMSEIQTIKTLLHEMTHSYLHNKIKLKERKQELTRSNMEVEAESVAFIVCDNLKIDTSDYSFAYLTSWLDETNGENFWETLTEIQKLSHYFINEIENLKKGF